MIFHQPFCCGAITLEKITPHRPGGVIVQIKTLFQKTIHAKRDLIKQTRHRRINCIIQIKNPSLNGLSREMGFRA